MNLKWSQLGFAGTIFHGAHHYINKKKRPQKRALFWLAVLNYKLLHVPFAQQQRLFNFFFAAFKGAILNLNAGVRIVPNIG